MNAGTRRAGTRCLAETLALLGSGPPEIRIGAIYALERLARRSAGDHQLVVAVLAAYVREHSHPAQADARAAVTVISRCGRAGDREPVDLSGADLTRLRLPGADLAGARLARVSLRRARLPGARLGGADLTAADLAFSDLSGADLAAADLTAADLTGARLAGAYLIGATLTRATLATADLTSALIRHRDAEAAGWTGPGR